MFEKKYPAYHIGYGFKIKTFFMRFKAEPINEKALIQNLARVKIRI